MTSLLIRLIWLIFDAASELVTILFDTTEKILDILLTDEEAGTTVVVERVTED